MRRLGWAFVLALVPALALASGAAPPGASAREAAPPGATAHATVAQVVDGDTVILAAPVMGATSVRLVGIQAPKLPLGRAGFEAWPLAGESKAALAALVLGRAVALSFGGAEKDRHGRLLAHLAVVPGGAWVQGEMLSLGMARVYSFADNRARVAEMLALEGAARAAKRGVWGHPFYDVRRPGGLLGHVGTFQVVEGRVVDTARVRSRVYLNFGDDWRDDFTVALDAEAGRLFRGAGVDPLALKGRRVRVRGWIKRYNGPLIDATHPEQVEVLDDRPSREKNQ